MLGRGKGGCNLARGIIYCMTTIVPGLVKIGKTGVDNFEQRMYSLERNGYAQVVGLKRRFAIKVNDYDEKETLLHDIFSKSNVPNTELFALDIELVVQLLSSLDGKQVYPKTISKEEVFDTATDERREHSFANSVKRFPVPDGEYYLSETVKGYGTIHAKMRASQGSFTVLKGSKCLPCDKDWMPEARKNAVIKEGILQNDVPCHSPSTAGWVVLGHANNGWLIWKTEDNQPIDLFRKDK